LIEEIDMKFVISLDIPVEVVSVIDVERVAGELGDSIQQHLTFERENWRDISSRQPAAKDSLWLNDYILSKFDEMIHSIEARYWGES
jgi:hypothetical protein